VTEFDANVTRPWVGLDRLSPPRLSYVSASLRRMRTLSSLSDGSDASPDGWLWSVLPEAEKSPPPTPTRPVLDWSWSPLLRRRPCSPGSALVPCTNFPIAVFGVVGALLYLGKQPRSAERPHLDIPGTLTVTAGWVAIVYGFSNAESNSWGSAVTISCLVAGVVLLVAFVLVQQRVAHPLLPLRVLLDRDRGGSFLAMALVAIAMFGVFLFLTYYLQVTLGFTALRTGLAFLPMSASIMFSATVLGARLLPRVGPKAMITVGGLVSALGMVPLTRIGLHSGYVSVVLPGLVAMGLGLGLIFSAAFSTATLGVQRGDAGVASAAVNTMQQVGGSIGTALLSTLSASAITSYLTGRIPSVQVRAMASLQGYHVAFWCSAGAFVAVALVGATVVRGQRARTSLTAQAPTDGDAPRGLH